MLNITESSSDELLDDSTFLPSESLLFTPEKFDRTDEDLGMYRDQLQFIVNDARNDSSSARKCAKKTNYPDKPFWILN